MTEHWVDIVEIKEIEIFKGIEIKFIATYQYCAITDDLLETEEMIKKNFTAMEKKYLLITKKA